MKKTLLLGLSLAFSCGVVLAQHDNAPNELTIQTHPHRCQLFGDSLGQPEARGRMAWLSKCIDKVQDPSVRAFYKLAINDPVCQQDRPCYVTFGKEGSSGHLTNLDHLSKQPFRAPFTASDDCAATDIINRNNFKIAAICLGGCYEPTDMLLFSDGEFKSLKDSQDKMLGTKSDNLKLNVVTLEQDSSSGNFIYANREVERYFVTESGEIDGGHSKDEILRIQLEDGNNLNVTPDHPIVDGDGRIQRARDLKPGGAVLTVDSANYPNAPIVSPTKISRIKKKIFEGKVYNLNVAKSDSKVVVVNNVLNGTMYWQNSPTETLNRVLFTMNLEDDLVR
ncbi:MAG: hypothetical protein HYV97_01440 [Bdellovibrio sp.]|nr:hypothetical protein [Bdellovibrio sp.]